MGLGNGVPYFNLKIIKNYGVWSIQWFNLRAFLIMYSHDMGTYVFMNRLASILSVISTEMANASSKQLKARTMRIIQNV